MITFITGQIIKLSITDKGDSTDILTQSGVAYRVHLPSGHLKYVVGEEAQFYTSFQVREDSQTLYGFLTEESRDFFEKIIGVSGIGPKIGMAILSTYSVNEVIELVKEGDYKALSKTPGLGSKGAQKIIVEMKGKFDVSDTSEVDESNLLKELKSALSSLGFKPDEVREMVLVGQDIIQVNENMGLEQLLQSVLRNSK